MPNSTTTSTFVGVVIAAIRTNGIVSPGSADVQSAGVRPLSRRWRVRRWGFSRRPIVESLDGAVGVEHMGLTGRLLARQVAATAVDLHPRAGAWQPQLVDGSVRGIPPLLGDVLPAAVVVPRHVGDVAAERRARRGAAIAPAS